MPLIEAIYLGFVVLSFATFAAVLAGVTRYERAGARRRPVANVPQQLPKAVSHSQIKTKLAA